MADAGKEPSDFTVSPFPQFQLQKTAASLFLLDADGMKAEETIRKVHSPAEFSERCRLGDAGHLDPIPSHHFVTRVCQMIGQRPVIGDQQKALRVFVQPANCEQSPAAVRDQIDRPRASGRVPVGAHHALWLVQDVVSILRQPQPLTVKTDILLVSVNGHRGICDHFTIHRDAPRADQIFTVPA